MEIIAAIIGVIAGFALSEIKSWLTYRKKLTSHWAAIRTEVGACHAKAKMFLADNIMAPLYRLPTMAYTNCVPNLLVDGEISEQELNSISAFYSQVQDLNRGLDMTQSRYETVASEKDPVLGELFVRNKLYANKLITGNEGEFLTAIQSVLNTKK